MVQVEECPTINVSNLCVKVVRQAGLSRRDV
jgi:hypothetical protein